MGFSVSSAATDHMVCFITCLLLFSSSYSPVFATSSTQGIKETSKYRYPFIRLASTFSSSSSSSSSDGGESSSSPPPSPPQSSSSKTGEYEYIIIGGGTAGCPLATTLSQHYKVLLLERGGVPFDNYNVSFMQNFHISLADTSSTSASQCFISTDGVYNSRARVLGGGSCINAGFYTRASSSYVRRAGWDAKLVNESYPWVERQIVHKPQLARWQQAVRDGLLDVGVSPFNGFTYDHKYGTKVGGTIFESNGRRHTAAELLATANPKNLDVLIHATVERITFDTRENRPKATGVIFKDENGKKHEVFLSNRRESEIFLTSGAIGSPQLLLLSGIGPKQDLQKLNISVVHDNKFVGKEMQDNPMNTIFIPTKKHVKQSLIQTVGITKKGVYIEASSGFGQDADSIRCHHGLASAEIGQLSTIPPKQRTHEAIQAYKDRKRDLPIEAFKGGFILEKLARPMSKGELKLNNTNVEDNPEVTFNYFSHPQDLQRCVEGIRMIEKLVKSEHFTNTTGCDTDTLTTKKLLENSVKANINLIPKQTNDTTSLEQFCKDTVVTIWHYHGGCHVGKVVAHDYRVIGVDRLRVVDGSTFKESPGTNPQATVMMMGRYMGLKILRERLGRIAENV